MAIWYCELCGDYQFSEPETRKERLGSLDIRFLNISSKEKISLDTKWNYPISNKNPFGDEEEADFWVCPTCRLETGDTRTMLKLDKQNDELRMLAEKLQTYFPSGRIEKELGGRYYAPLNFLIYAISRAKLFIHITSESLDSFFLGLLSAKKPDCYVRVLIWHKGKISEGLGRAWERSRLLEEKVGGGIRIVTMPEIHQKLIVIDGLIAFKGSVNTTLAGWTREGELVEFTVDLVEVNSLNKTYFAEFMKRGWTKKYP